MLDYSVNDFEIIRFFSYTSTIPYGKVTVTITPNNMKWYPNLCEKFDQFYYLLAEEASKVWKEKTGFSIFLLFQDNKTVFELKHKDSGKTFFIGRYDFHRTIGTGCHLYDGYVFDMVNGKKSDYISDVICDHNGEMWKKFEITNNN